MDGYYELAAAILRQAIMDYKSAVRILLRHPRNPNACKERADLRRFFRSEFFTVLSDTDGESLMRKIEKLAEEKLNNDCT